MWNVVGVTPYPDVLHTKNSAKLKYFQYIFNNMLLLQERSYFQYLMC